MASVKKGTRFFIDASSAANLKEALEQYPPTLFIQASAALGDALEPFKQIMVKRSSNPPGPIAEGEGVHERTGRLKRSWGVAVSGSSIANLKGAAFSFAGVKAPLLELGGVARPGGASDEASNIRAWIFIPTDNNRNADGTARYTPRQAIDAGAHFINRHKKGYLYDEGGYVDGRPSPAWNLLVGFNANPFAYHQSDVLFIMTKTATYRPMLGFYESGGEFGRNVLPGKLADASVKAWKELDKV